MCWISSKCTLGLSNLKHMPDDQGERFLTACMKSSWSNSSYMRSDSKNRGLSRSLISAVICVDRWMSRKCPVYTCTLHERVANRGAEIADSTFLFPLRIRSQSGDFIMHNRITYHVAIHGAFLSDLHCLRSDNTAGFCERYGTVGDVGVMRDLNLGSVVFPTL